MRWCRRQRRGNQRGDVRLQRARLGERVVAPARRLTQTQRAPVATVTAVTTVATVTVGVTVRVPAVARALTV